MNDAKVRTNWRSISILLILVSVIVLYGPTITYEYNLDDNYITENLPSPSEGIKGVFSVFSTRFDDVSYRPISTFTVALEQYITGTNNVHFSHAVNVLLFALTSLICFIILLKLPLEKIMPTALLVTLLFVVHPIHSNVVSSIKNRDVLLSFLFGMLSLYYFLKFISGEKRKYYLLIPVVLLILLASLCKADSLGFILVFPLVYLIFYPSENILKSLGWSVAMVAITTAIVLSISNQIQRIAPIMEYNIGSAVLFTENPLVGPRTLMATLSGGLTSFFYYVKFHLWPTGYYFYFGYDMISLGTIISLKNIAALILLVATGISVIYFWTRDKLLVFGLLFFCATIFYALNMITLISGIVAPRLAFIASFGFCIITVRCIHQILILFSDSSSKINRNTIIAMLPILMIGAIFTFQRNHAWKNFDTLITADMPSLERSFQAQRIAMAHYSKVARDEPHPEFRQEYLRTALKHAQLAHDLYDDHIFVEEGMGVIQYFLGNRDSAKAKLTMVTEKYDDALQSFEILGDIYFYEGNYGTAAEYFKKHIERDPTYNGSYYKLTSAMVSNYQVEESIEFNKQLILDYPDDYIGYDNLGYSYLLSRDTMKSAIYFVEALKRGLEDDAVMYILQDYYMQKNMQQEWLELIKEINPLNGAQ